MVLVSVQSVENDNGYQFSNDFAESLIIDPKSRISLININFSRNKSLYTVDSYNDEFQIRMGEYNQDYEGIRVTHGNYTAVLLANEIQKQLNRHFFLMGYYFTFGYNPKDNKFFINYSYSENNMENLPMSKWTLIGDANAPQIKYDEPSTSVIIETANMTIGDNVFMVSQETLETEDVPFLAQGGSSIQMTLKTGEAPGTWPTFKPADAVPPENGFVWGLVGSANPVYSPSTATPVKGIVEVANMGYMLSGLAFTVRPDQLNVVRIIENGHKIGDDIPHQIDDLTDYKITLSLDGADGVNGYPTYYYKRLGQVNWSRIIPRAGSGLTATQAFGKTIWNDMPLYAVVGADAPTSVPDHPQFNNLLMNHANANYQGVDFAGPVAERLGPLPDKLVLSGDAPQLDWSLTNTDKTMLYSDFKVTNTGFLTPLIAPDRQSRMTFKMPKTEPIAI